MPDQAVVKATDVMRKGSVSFFLASRLLPKQTRESVTMLYRWCRHCDDVIDGQELGQGAAVVKGSVDDLVLYTEGPMGSIVRQHDIPAHYPRELLEGMRMDVDGIRYDTYAELKLYCFRVAGTVGLMFSHISGVSDPDARRYAADLGMAMQLTNIARDVGEDFARGRIYLPLAWLREAGINPSRLMEEEQRPALCAVVERLLVAADGLYASGMHGLRYLPWRSALAVAAAKNIYSEIGQTVRARGADAWTMRCFVSTPRKLRLVGQALVQMFKAIPGRLRHPWRAAPLKEEWRFS